MSSPKNIDDRTDMLAAEYALGTMPHGERIAFESRLKNDALLVRRVAWWNNQFVSMSDDIASVQTPASVLKNIESRLFASTTARHSWWESLGFWRGLALASLTGVIVLGGLLANNQLNSGAPTQTYVAQLAGDNSDLQVAALYDATSKTLKLNRTSGKAAVNRDFEMWVIAGGNAPVSLGVMPLDASFEITVPEKLREALAQNAILAISDEPSGGSPTGQPSGAVLATGAVTKI